MNLDRQALDIFEEALNLPVDAREEYLEAACSDSELLNQVRALLSNAEACDDFLETHSLSPTDREQSEDRSTAIQFPTGSVLQGRYEIVSVLGQGGMGEVYLGQDTRLERAVAIKVVRQLGSDTGELRQRFDRELKSVAQLSSANVVTLFDYVLDETPFAVMEFVKGKTLEQLIAQRIEFPAAKKIAIGIATGLAAAHDRQLIHRDIKPANVIVTAEGIAKILDFGLARRGDLGAEQNLTHSSVTPGTIPYMSPEQADGRNLTAATDVFSFGTVLYEMLSGRNPFRGDSALSTMNNIVSAVPPRLDTFCDAVPSGLVELVHAMLAKEPRGRPTASDVANELTKLTSESDFHVSLGQSTSPEGPVQKTPESTRRAGLERTRLRRSTNWQPSLIILPFQAFGEDRELADLADGLVENLTTILTRVPMLSITSRLTSFSLKGEPITANPDSRAVQCRLHGRR